MDPIVSKNDTQLAHQDKSIFRYLPNDLLPVIAQSFDCCATIASFKRTCKRFDQSVGYQDLPPAIIECEDYDIITDGLIATAHHNKDKDHDALLKNDPKNRSRALTLLGWDEQLSLKENMCAYCGIPAKNFPNSISSVLKNNLTLKILCSSINPNIMLDCAKTTALYEACDTGRTKAVKLLLRNNQINPNIQKKGRYTALFVACYKGHAKIVQLLLDHPKTNPNIQNKVFGETALFIACQNGHLQIVQLLLNHPKTNPNIKDTSGNTAILTACFQKHLKIVKLLLTLPNIQDHNGNTALHRACIQYDTEQVILLLDKDKTDLNIQNNDGNTALHIACIQRNTKIAQLLIDKDKTNLNIQNNEGNTVLHLACSQYSTKIVDLLNQTKIDPNIQNNNGYTALDIAPWTEGSSYTKMASANTARHSWMHYYRPRALGITLLAILIGYYFYTTAHNSVTS